MRSLWIQAACAANAAFMMFGSGIAVGWGANALLQLTNGVLDFTVTAAEASWVVSFFDIGLMFSCIHVRLMLDSIGRKKCLVFHGLPIVVGWIILLFSRSVWQLCIGRFLLGLGAGCDAVSVAYVSEIAENDNRGPLTGLLFNVLLVGLLTSFILGAFLSYRTAIIVYLCLSATTYTIGCMILPETPYFLYMKNRNSEAKVSLAKLRPGLTEEELETESTHVYNIVKKDMKNKSTFYELFTNKLHRKSLIIFTVLRFLESASGLGVVGTYTPTILFQSGQSIELSQRINIALGVVIIASVFVVPLISAKIGRKPLLISGLIGVSIGCITLGIFFFMKDTLAIAEDIIKEFKWLPIVGLCIFSVFACNALGPMIIAIQSEIFRTNVKALAFVYGIALTGLFNVGAIQFYQATSNAVSIYLPFWSFSVLLIGAMLFVALYIPETKDKSFDEIQDLLNGRNKLKNDPPL